MGIVALRRIKESDGAETGAGLAKAGIVVSSILGGFTLLVFLGLTGMSLFGTSASDRSDVQCDPVTQVCIGESNGDALPSLDADGGESALLAYEDITAMNTDLAAAGITCTLEYEGLVDDIGKEVSLCTIDGEQAQLTRYPDFTTVDTVVSADVPIGAIAYGQNWTVQVDTPATAEAIATALGGETITADAATATTVAPTPVAP